jgi:hypothetical protein
MVMEIVVRIIATNSGSERDRKALMDQAAWLLSFFPAAFAAAAKMGRTDHWNAVRACDSLAYFGMAFHKSGTKEFAVSAARQIVSVTASYCRATQSLKPLNVADLLVYGYQLELAVRATADEKAGGDIERLLYSCRLPDASVWDQVLKGLNLRKIQLKEELASPDYGPSPFQSTQLLHDILSSTAVNKSYNDESPH